MRKLYVLAVLMAVAGCEPGTEAGQAPLMHTQEQSATSGCYVTVYCSDGTSRTCSGASACSAAPTASTPSVTCDGASSYCSTPPPPPNSCTINGVTYSSGATNPSNPCQLCDPARSTTSWSNKADYVSQTGVCKTTLHECYSGPCIGNFCVSNADCSSGCQNGYPMCQGAL